MLKLELGNGLRACLMLSMLAACGGAPDGAENTDILASDDSALIGGTEFTAAQAAQTGIIAIKDGCTGALVGSRYILTAAHCAQSPNYFFGGKIKIAQTGRVTAATVWTTVTINQTFIHPGWTAMCLVSSCADDQTLVAPYSPDIAVIQLTANVPVAFKKAVIPRTRYNLDAEVWTAGYGCEVSVGGAAPTPPRLKMDYTRTLAPARINDFGSVVLPANVAQFSNSNIITAGIRADATSASLCPGDSGGPLFLSTPVAQGPTFPRNQVIAVNAYYTFKDASGKSARNIHARLYDNGVTQAWLETILPASSFVFN